MQNFLKYILTLAFCVFLCFSYRAYAFKPDKDTVFFNSIKKVGIKTVIMEKKNDAYAFPLVRLGSDERIQLLFDDLGDSDATYFYEIIHCTWDWYPSGLDPFYYSDGQVSGVLSEFRQSFNTTVDYRHYSLHLPNEDVTFSVSGNYVLIVYEERDGERHDVLIRRFSVVEDLVSIEGRVKRPVDSDWPDREQSLLFSVHLQDYTYYDVFDDFLVVVLQNENWQTARVDFIPARFSGKRLVYDNESKQVFPAGNVYRYFAIRNFRTPVSRVRDIYFDPAERRYSLQLVADEPRPFEHYKHEEDINGKFRIDTRDKQDVHVRADYANVHFSLNYTVPFTQAVCVMSSLFSFRCDEQNRLTYHFADKQYQLDLLLKQGYYNYQYGVLDDGEVDMSLIEGSHYQTENAYQILFYDKSLSHRHHRLIGAYNVQAKF